MQYYQETLTCNNLKSREKVEEIGIEEMEREIEEREREIKIEMERLYSSLVKKIHLNEFLNQNLEKYIFISSNRIYLELMTRIWDNISLTSKEDKVVEALQIIEPKVERIGFYISEVQEMIRVKLKGEKNPLPLSSMGDGMSRILSLAMAAVTAENGVLLVDEIDTGLHYQVQTDMWRLIIQTARELNIQVFATTHSWDCICALQEVLAELEDKSIVKLFRLSQKYGKLRAVEYDSEDIDIAVRQSIEVR